jgi:hypothetical protein
MCNYCKAASAVLDTLWEEPDLREHFHALGVDLSDLGPLTHEVFVPAYLAVKEVLDAQALTMLEAQVAEDLLSPYYDRTGFREIWDEWDEETRQGFVSEQSEAALAGLLLRLYADEFADAYKSAFAAYSKSS